MQNQIIEEVTAEKDLGIINDNHMKFYQYVSFTASKAMRIIKVIWKIFCSISIDTFLSLYNSLNMTTLGVWKCDLGAFLCTRSE